jgi:amino acid transporter
MQLKLQILHKSMKGINKWYLIFNLVIVIVIVKLILIVIGDRLYRHVLRHKNLEWIIFKDPRWFVSMEFPILSTVGRKLFAYILQNVHVNIQYWKEIKLKKLFYFY